ncbi:hypothetical protein AQUSIP_09070 [Aquicella siphonis]|uniref:Uncharacterized protein n=2 Tax=Aquicella siphonis TaxID=254247 RepID=A0A5E4PGN1_9COXI|nr:hypothetical protein AQUSIP_09070 [Aquicella siphonis]
MQYFSPSAPYIHPPDKNISRMKTEKITFSLVKHVYEQTITAMLASLFCTSLILFVLYDSRNSNVILLVWAAFTFSVTFARIALVLFFKSYDYAENRLKLWVNLYILGALLGGACWGLMGIYLFPSANPVEQTFMILMVAGVTAGAVPLSAAIPGAAAGFLIAAIVPLILTIALIDNHVYHLFDFALSVYLSLPDSDHTQDA